MSVVDLQMARLERETDNTKVSVEELLRLALKEVTDGDLKGATRAFMCIVVEGEDRRETLEGLRCGLSRSEELGYIEAFKMQSWKHWVEK